MEHYSSNNFQVDLVMSEMVHLSAGVEERDNNPLPSFEAVSWFFTKLHIIIVLFPSILTIICLKKNSE